MNRLRAFPALLGFLLFWAGTSFAATNSVPDKDLLPQQLDLSWTGLPGLNSCSVKWGGKSLVYQQRYRGKMQVEINPSIEQWKRFWEIMDEVNVWGWQRRYDNLQVRDGMVWHIKIEHGTKKVECYGSNAYPGESEPNTSSISPTKLFLKYQKAVEELNGRKVWAH